MDIEKVFCLKRKVYSVGVKKREGGNTIKEVER